MVKSEQSLQENIKRRSVKIRFKSVYIKAKVKHVLIMISWFSFLDFIDLIFKRSFFLNLILYQDKQLHAAVLTYVEVDYTTKTIQ